jgi:hypothetical protein
MNADKTGQRLVGRRQLTISWHLLYLKHSRRFSCCQTLFLELFEIKGFKFEQPCDRYWRRSGNAILPVRASAIENVVRFDSCAWQPMAAPLPYGRGSVTR